MLEYVLVTGIILIIAVLNFLKSQVKTAYAILLSNQMIHLMYHLSTLMGIEGIILVVFDIILTWLFVIGVGTSENKKKEESDNIIYPPTG